MVSTGVSMKVPVLIKDSVRRSGSESKAYDLVWYDTVRCGREP